MAKKKKKTKVHLVTYTHWDREFRWDFEQTRIRLVDALDDLLAIMENDPEYKSFMLDGQLTLVEDYLEVRPEKRETITQFVKDGRLEVGPWYTLPDCSPVHCESVIRNLQYGYRRSQEYGGVMQVGYNVFSFGQIAQLPQICASFGIDTILFYKYMDPSRTKHSEFFWEAPDGTRALASRLGREARWNFFFAAQIPIAYDRDPWHKDWQYKWGDDFGKVFHTADPDSYGWFYDILDPEAAYHPQRIPEAMQRAMETIEGTAFPDEVLMFDGTDFTAPHPLTSQIYDEIRKHCGDDYEIVHSRLEDYIASLKKALMGRKDLEVLTGSMRDGPVGAVHSDVYTVHPEIPILNSDAETAILRYAEPLAAMAWAHGIDAYPSTYLDKIWKLMFQSHAHDSLHGLGPQTLVDGETSRLKQAKVIADGLKRRGLENITKEINTSTVEDAELFLTVHNTATWPRTEVVEAYVDIPASVALEHVIIEDEKGKAVQVQEVERRENIRAGVYHPRNRNMPFYCTKVHLYFLAENIPATGFKTFKLKWAEKREYPYPHEDWDPPRILADDLVSGPNQAENDHVRVTVNSDGTVDLVDKESGRAYLGLNYLVDQGEVGNMWMSVTPPKDAMITSAETPAEVRLVEHGPLCVVFEVRTKMTLPAEFDWHRQERSTTAQEMPVSIRYTLTKTNPYLQVDLTFDNNVKDHYLRVCFPTDIKAERTWTEGAFWVENYPVKPSRDGELRGKELARHPSQLWFDLWDGERGLAILNDAPKDYEILEHDTPGTLAMGLLRAVRLRIPCDNRLWMEYPGDESAQSQGEHHYRYAIMPHKRRWDHAKLSGEAIGFRAPVRVCQIGKQEGQFPLTKGFFEMTGANLILGAMKKAVDRNSVIARFVNTTVSEKKVTLKVGFPFKKAFVTNLNEERERELKVDDKGNVKLTAAKGKIITVEFAL